MWWPLRNQILVPVAALLVVAVTATSLTSAYLAARQQEELTRAQLERIISTLGATRFPYTPPVLHQMRGLSGAHFVTTDATGELTASTFSDSTSLLSIPRKPVSAVGEEGSLSPFADRSPVTVGGEAFFVSWLPITSLTRPAWLLVLYPEKAWRQSRWDAVAPSLLVGAATLFLMVQIAALISHRLGRRLRRVQEQVTAIAEGGFEQIAIDGPSDEIRELAVAVNRMSSRLQELQRTIRQSERARLLGQLAGGLAHQIRNSVTGAKMALELHRRRCIHDPMDESLGVAIRQLTLTESEIRRLLVLGRPSHEALRKIDLARLLRETVDLIRPAMEHARMDFTVEGLETALFMPADGEGLQAAVLNLLHNAAEAAGKGGFVRLLFHADYEMARIEVLDGGPGPAQELAATLFDPFVTDKTEGVGLGLLIAKECADRHGGRLTWERRGDVTAFILAMPLESATKSSDTEPRVAALIEPARGENK
ncbi:MAG: ATP-binding protein [Planctomycetota bacterium]